MEDISDIITNTRSLIRKQPSVHQAAAAAAIMEQGNPYPIERPAAAVQSAGAPRRQKEPMGRADNVAGVFLL